MAGSVRVSMTVNGAQESADVEPRLLLVHFLRETLGLTGTHVGCDTSNCGACTVHLNGEAVKSCTLLAVQADGAEVKTIEGMGQEGDAASAAGGVLGAPRPAVRLLHAGHDHGLGRSAAAQPEAVRAGGPRGARGQPLPLHGLPQHRQGRPRRPPKHDRHRGRALGRAADQAQGGPAADHGPRALHRRHQRHRAAVGGVRPLARGAREDHLDRHAARPRPTRACTPSSPATTSTSRRRCRWRGCRRASRSRTRRTGRIAKDEVHYVGDPVALVIGSDRYAVVDAAEQVLVEYDPLPVVVDIETALEDGADLVHADLGTNKCHEWSLGGGDIEAGFAAADVIVERRVVNHRTAGAAIEPRGVLADYRAGLADAHLAPPRSRTSCGCSSRSSSGSARSASGRSRPRSAAASAPSCRSTARRSRWRGRHASSSGRSSGSRRAPRA